MNDRHIKITIAIPAYNAEKTIAKTLMSCFSQEYPDKEVLVWDDGSTDLTAKIAEAHGARVIIGEENRGIGHALIQLMDNAKGRYIIYMCADDQFTSSKVLGDYVRQFNEGEQNIGIIGRFFYQYVEGFDGAVNVSRDRNILTQSCCPSGMAFRVVRGLHWSNKIFVEMPLIVKQYLDMGYKWTMFEYDTFKARIHPGGNTGTKKEYYTESPIQNWTDLVGKDFKFHEGFVQLRNRRPGILLREIRNSIRINPKNLLDPKWWLYVSISLIVPGFISRPLSDFYRIRISRPKCSIIERPFK